MGSDLSSQLNKALLIVALKSLDSNTEEEQTVLQLTSSGSDGLIAIRQNKTIVAARIVGFEGTSIQALRKLLPITEGELKEEHAFPADLKLDLNIDIKKLLNDLQAASDKAKKPPAAAPSNSGTQAAAAPAKPVIEPSVAAPPPVAAVSVVQPAPAETDIAPAIKALAPTQSAPSITKPVQPLLRQSASVLTPLSTPKPVVAPAAPVVETPVVKAPEEEIDTAHDTAPDPENATKINTEFESEAKPIIETAAEVSDQASQVVPEQTPSDDVHSNDEQLKTDESNVEATEIPTGPATFEDDVQDYKQEVSYQTAQYEPEVENLMRQPDAPVGKNSKVGQVAVTSLIKRKKGESTGSITPIDTAGQDASAQNDSSPRSDTEYDISALNSIPDPNIKSANINQTEKPLRTESTAKVRSLSNLDETEETRKSKARNVERKQNLQKNKFKILGGIAAVSALVGGFFLWQRYAETSLADKIELSFTNEKMDDTHALVAQGLQQFPNAPKFHFYKGRMLAKENKFKEAIAEYEIALAPNAEPYNLRYVAYEGKAYVATGEMEKALELLNRVLEFPVTDHNSYLNRCVAFMATGNFPGAVADAKRAVELMPDKLAYHSTLAVAYNLNKNYKESIKEWTRIISKEPKNVDAYVGRANAESSNNQSALALKDYSKSIALKPNGNAFYSRGMLSSVQKNYKAAIEDFTTALRYEPKNTLFLSALAKAFTASGDTKKGMAVYQQMSSISPESTAPDVLLDRINTEIAAGKFRQAEEDLNQLVEKDPQNVALRLRHATTAEQAEEFTKALDDYTALIARYPKNAMYYAKRAGTHVRLRHFDLAKQDLEKAASLDPKKKNVDIFTNRAMVEAQNGEFTQALADIAVALKLEPNSSTAKQRLVEIQKMKNSSR